MQSEGIRIEWGSDSDDGEDKPSGSQEILDLLFLISGLPLIYPFPSLGPSDGPPLFPESPSLHSPALEIPQENSPPSDHVSQRR